MEGPRKNTDADAESERRANSTTISWIEWNSCVSFHSLTTICIEETPFEDGDHLVYVQTFTLEMCYELELVEEPFMRWLASTDCVFWNVWDSIFPR